MYGKGGKLTRMIVTVVLLWFLLSALSSAVAEMGDRFATTYTGRKVGEGAAGPFPWGELGLHLTL